MVLDPQAFKNKTKKFYRSNTSLYLTAPSEIRLQKKQNVTSKVIKYKSKRMTLPLATYMQVVIQLFYVYIYIYIY